jgi:hypothetical protein
VSRDAFRKMHLVMPDQAGEERWAVA